MPTQTKASQETLKTSSSLFLETDFNTLFEIDKLAYLPRAERITGSLISGVGTAGFIRGVLLLSGVLFTGIAGALSGGIVPLLLEGAYLIAGVTSSVYQYKKLGKPQSEAELDKIEIRNAIKGLSHQQIEITALEGKIQAEMAKHIEGFKKVHEARAMYKVMQAIQQGLQPISNENRGLLLRYQASFENAIEYNDALQFKLLAKQFVTAAKLNITVDDFFKQPNVPYSERFTPLPPLGLEVLEASSPKLTFWNIVKSVKNVAGFTVGAFFLGITFGGPIGGIIGLGVGLVLGTMSGVFNYRKEKIQADPRRNAKYVKTYFQNNLRCAKQHLSAKQNNYQLAAQTSKTNQSQLKLQRSKANSLLKDMTLTGQARVYHSFLGGASSASSQPQSNSQQSSKKQLKR